jgi:hypothetical protein
MSIGVQNFDPPHCLTENITGQLVADDWAGVTESFGGLYGGKDQHGRAAKVVSAVTEHYRSAKRAEKGRILDALCDGLASQACGARTSPTRAGWA